MRDFFELVVFPIFFLFLLIAGCSDGYGRYVCGAFEKQTGRETRWQALDSCYVKAEAGWQRYSEYEKRAIASEGLGGLASDR